MFMRWLKPSLLYALLLITSPSALAQRDFEGAGPLSVWEQSRQMQRDYIAHLKTQLAADPNNLSLQLNLGRAYYWLALERDEAAMVEAEKLFAQILARDSSNAAALAFHGSILGLKIGFNFIPEKQIAAVAAQSAQEMDRAVALAPDSIEVRQLRGYSSFHTPSIAGRDHLAIKDFSHVISLLERMPKSEGRRAEVHLILGDAYRKMDRTAEARAEWERASQLRPNSPLAMAAEFRLRTYENRNEAAALNVKKLTAFFGFLIGAIIFAILTTLVLRDVIRMQRRKRGMVASLVVALAALLWNGLHLTLTIFEIAGMEQHALWQRMVAWLRHDLYLILALSPIPFGLIIAYRFYKATFMDIVLKRGAALLAIFILSMLYAQWVIAPLTLTILRLPNETLRSICFTALWLALFALYPPLRDRIYSLVDRYLFKRRDYSRLLDWFTDRLRAATDDASLLAASSGALQEAFAADSAHFVPASDELARNLSAAAEKDKSRALLRRQIADGALEAELDARQVELALLIRSNEEFMGVILIGPRAYGQQFLSEELSVLRAVAAEIGRMMENLRLHEARRRQAIAEEELRKLVAEAELKALRAQIDPHFFFNALNSVAALINDDPKAAEELLEDISDLFRHAFKPSRDFIPLSQELELVETYLKVERVRLGNKLQFKQAVLPDTLTIKIPTLTIQPLVENAVKHGIGGNGRGGNITLSAAVTDHCLNISVADTGVGIGPSALRDLFSRGVGLSNVNKRLIGLYGETARLHIDTLPGQGTTVSFAIPLIKETVMCDA
jgi:signal transduction histidine kinase